MVDRDGDGSEILMEESGLRAMADVESGRAGLSIHCFLSIDRDLPMAKVGLREEDEALSPKS